MYRIHINLQNVQTLWSILYNKTDIQTSTSLASQLVHQNFKRKFILGEF